MSKIISVITAAHRPSFAFLEDALESVNSQELPDDWELEWVIQLDGAGAEEIAATVAADPRVKLASVHKSGPAVARTVALSRSRGSLIKTLDADDKLLPKALLRDIEILDNDPSVGWTACRGLDLHPDGSIVGWEHHDPEEGLMPAGWVLEQWLSNNWLLPILPGTVCIRRNLLLAMGGWMALSTSEDTGLLVPATSVADGYFIATPGLLYRQHPEQVTAQDHHTDDIPREARRKLIAERARAVVEMWGPGSRRWD